jgi:hypothetical protein
MATWLVAAGFVCVLVQNGLGASRAWGVLTWRGAVGDRVTKITSPKKRQWQLLDKELVYAAILRGESMPYPAIPAVEAAKAQAKAQREARKQAAAAAAATSSTATATAQPQAVSTAPTESVQMA